MHPFWSNTSCGEKPSTSAGGVLPLLVDLLHSERCEERSEATGSQQKTRLKTCTLQDMMYFQLHISYLVILNAHIYYGVAELFGRVRQKIGSGFLKNRKCFEFTTWPFWMHRITV